MTECKNSKGADHQIFSGRDICKEDGRDNHSCSGAVPKNK